MKNKIKQWSYSRYAIHQQCPFKLKCKAIDRLPDPSSYTAQRGLIAHAKAESFVNGNIRGMPKELAKLRNEFRNVKKLRAKNTITVLTEFDSAVALNKNKWVKSKGDDWNNVWCRGLIDLLILEKCTATDIDYKTGKQYDTHEDQGELYAIQTMVHHPNINIVDVEFWYLDLGEVDGWAYNRKDLKKLQKKWEKKVKPMLTDTKFKPTPGWYCKWCNYSSDKNGPCKFNENGE